MSFLLAHLSDPHVGPLPRARLWELAGKRLTGYLNWRRGRGAIHDMAILDRLIADMAAHGPDHVALTGDLVNIGLAAEFVGARRLVATLGHEADVSVIPGNHDAYVRSSLPHMIGAIAPWMTGDGAAACAFPYLRVRGPVALIGLSSGIPTGPFLASGALGEAQCTSFAAMLRQTRDRGLVRVVMIHHPPHRSGARRGRGLRDAAVFEALIGREGAELVIHGHNHRYSLAWLRGPSGKVPVVGVASASAMPGSPDHRAAYHLYRIEGTASAPAIGLTVRGIGPDGRPSTLRSEARLFPRD